MKQKQWQLALRELAAGMHQLKRVLALVSVTAILGVSGPFGTDDQMQILPQLLYWSVLSSALWLGNFATFCARQIHPAQRIAQFARQRCLVRQSLPRSFWQSIGYFCRSPSPVLLILYAYF